MAEILAGNGAILKMRDGKGAGIKVAGWPTGSVGQGLITLNQVNLEDKDVHIPVVAVDDFRSLFKFGQDFGDITLSGTIYLGCSSSSSSSSSASNVVQEVKKAYDSIRLSKIGKPVNVSVAGEGGGKWSVAFTSLQLSNVNPEFQTIQYSLVGLIVPTK